LDAIFSLQMTQKAEFIDIERLYRHLEQIIYWVDHKDKYIVQFSDIFLQ